MRLKNLFVFLPLMLLFAQAYAFGSFGAQSVDLTPELYKSGIKIIDIRTEKEWKETGIVKGSYPMTFYDENGRSDVSSFIRFYYSIASKDDTVGLLCKSGIRSKKAADTLYNMGFTKVVNLKGGILDAIKDGLPIIPYVKKE